MICIGVTLPVSPAWAMETRARLSDVTGVIWPKNFENLSKSGSTTRVKALLPISSWSRSVVLLRCCCPALRPSRRWLMLVVSEEGWNANPIKTMNPKKQKQKMRKIGSMVRPQCRRFCR